ncbi:hypothetical protein CSPAE12_03533 [Colletotrichum incanum]|nr:hypothetical protein CSPAE12_03533 [Colletotrichum incanum]
MYFFQKASSRTSRPDVLRDGSEKKADGLAPASTLSNPVSTPTSTDPFPHKKVMRAKYIDQSKLKTSLDSIYGEGNYLVKERANRYIIMLPTPMKDVRANSQP